ncbi:MAG: insulinase family protein [Firmicutes bacterium]|nr:insulinase family protein [Bacillota bacterium]
MYQRATLPNGLKIICESMPHVHSVSVGVWVGTGSRDENLKYNGISHLVEHLFFKGTANRSAKQIAEAIDAVGGQLNAFTTKEYTCYYVKVLSEQVHLGIELLADMIANSLFAPEDIEKEKQVVLEEIKSFEDSPDELVHDLFAGAVLKEHPLGWPILGVPESIARIDRRVIMEYLLQHYTADNMVFAAAGNVQFDQIVTAVEKGFSKLSGGCKRILPPLTAYRPEKILKYKDTEQVHLCVGNRGLERKHADRYAVFVLDSILGGSVSSRLFQELREERGLVYVTCSNHSSFKDTGIFSIYAGTSLNNFDQVLELVKREIKRCYEEPVAEMELSRAKEQLKGNLLLSMESTFNRMCRIAKLELYQDQLLTPEEAVAKVEAVAKEDVMRVAGEIFGKEDPVILALGPFAAK